MLIGIYITFNTSRNIYSTLIDILNLYEALHSRLYILRALVAVHSILSTCKLRLTNGCDARQMGCLKYNNVTIVPA